jgi:predicted RND superfamily exporter protein
MEDLIVVGQVRSLLGALLLIMALMVIEWRSLRGALLCMIPNLAPVFLIFAFMGVFGIWLDIATAMIASVAVGIAVDDTIHIYHGFISRQNRHGKTVWALARTYRQAGRAVTTTTLVLCAQFLILNSSDFVPTAHFGLLTSVGLLAAWLFDVVLLPAILVLIYGKCSSSISRQPRPLSG